MSRVVKPKPPIKWVGGKRQLISQFVPLFPKTTYDLYIEPFVGGGAVFFHLLPDRAVLIDKNEELINFYVVVRDNLDELLNDLRKHKNTREYYYAVRSLDLKELSPVERASRFLYLNKTAYNGLWRVNRQGKFNTAFGKYKNPRIVDEPNLRAVSEALKRVHIICDDFSRALEFAGPNVFVYLDPPYHSLSATSNYSAYTADGFGPEDQMCLADVFRELDKRGCLVMLSNSDTPLVRELYRDYDIQFVYARRAISCRSDRRGSISELVIRNYR